MKKSFFIFLSLVFIFSASVEISACWCRKDPEATNTEENFRKTVARLADSSDFVFAATLVEENTEQLIFEVKESWRGSLKGKVFFSKLHKINNGEKEYWLDSCEFDFKSGKSYLVYASATINGFSASECERTDLLENAERDVAELNRQKSLVSALISEPLFAQNYSLF